MIESVVIKYVLWEPLAGKQFIQAAGFSRLATQDGIHKEFGSAAYLDVLVKQGVNFPNFNKVGLDDPESVHDDRIDTLSLLYVKDAGNPYTESSKRYDGTGPKSPSVTGRPWRTKRT